MTHRVSGEPPPPPSRIGSVVAQRYRILAQLGEGGIGTVYLAEDLAQGGRVAVKLLKPALTSDAEVVARFDREARAMAALSHEHIVQALGFGRTPEGDICMAMELVEGESLRALLSRLKPFPVHGALDVARQLAAALARAHSLGVVHRDLKPENVMVTWRPDGRPFVKVLDFGMARILGAVFSGQSPLTKKGAVFGTPEYMSPEQAMGRPVEAPADQYSFGVIVFEMLAGRRPFSAPTPLDMLQLQIRTPAPRLGDVAPAVPAALSDAVARILAKRPDARFADVAAAMAALDAAAAWHPPRPGG